MNDNTSLTLLAYFDSYWVACSCTRHSVSGFYIMFGLRPISWKFRKPKIVSLSSIEAEYKSMPCVTIKIAWLTHLLDYLSIIGITPISLKCDSQDAIYIAKNHVFHKRTKYIVMQNHLIFNITLLRMKNKD